MGVNETEGSFWFPKMFGLTKLRPLVRVLASRGLVQVRNKSTGKEPYWYDRYISRVQHQEHEGWTYRQPFTATRYSPGDNFTVEASMTLFWWWLFTHLYWNWRNLGGHYWRPKITQLTNAELGIPSDDEE